MHRSGTSAITRVMNILGADLPDRLMPGAAANPVGHFEPQAIVNIHDELLGSAESSWSDWSAFPERWYRSNFHAAYREQLVAAVTADYAGSGLFLVKDPRLLRFVPLWLEVLRRVDVAPVAVLPFRNPIEVALSLNARDGFPLEHGYLLWLRHVLEAEFHSRAMPRTFLSYDRLLAHKQTTTYRLIEALPVTWPRKTGGAFDEITRFLDTKLRRSQASREDLSLHREIPDELRTVYSAYEQLETDPGDRAAMARLDDVRAEFDRTTSVLAGTFRALRARFEDDRRDATELLERVTAQEAAAEALAASLAAHADTLRRDHEAVRHEHGALRQDHEGLRHEQQALRHEHEALAQAFGAAQAETERLEVERRQALEHAAVLEAERRQGLERAATLEAERREAREAEAESRRVVEREAAVQAERRQAFEREAAIKAERRQALEREAVLGAEIRALRESQERQEQRLRAAEDVVTRLRGELQVAEHRREREAGRWWRRNAAPSGPEARAEIALRSGLFDPDWYRRRYLGSEPPGTSAIEHFVTVGSALNHSPGPLFDAAAYRAAYPDVAAAGAEPLFHYLAFGREEGRQSFPA